MLHLVSSSWIADDTTLYFNINDVENESHISLDNEHITNVDKNNFFFS